jgi:hypothetical protein
MSSEKLTQLTVDALTGEQKIEELTQEDLDALNFEALQTSAE